MFRAPNKNVQSMEKEDEKSKARKQVFQSASTFTAIVVLLKLGKFPKDLKNELA